MSWCTLCCGSTRVGHPKGQAYEKRALKSTQPTKDEATTAYIGGLASARVVKAESFPGDDKDNEDKKSPGQDFVDQVEAKALQLRCTVHKYPSTGARGGIFKVVDTPKLRYIALVPQRDDPDACAGKPSPLTMWANGTLSYWETETAFTQNKEAKGSIMLLKIAKVNWDKSSPAGLKVTVKHKDNDKFHELVLRFGTKREAEEWSYGLWDLISRLRKAIT